MNRFLSCCYFWYPPWTMGYIQHTDGRKKNCWHRSFWLHFPFWLVFFSIVCVCPCSTTGVQIYRSAISVEAFFAHLNDLCVGFFFAILWWRVGEKKVKTEPHNRSISENGWTFFLSVLLCIMLLWMGIVLPMNGMYSSVFSDISLHSSQAHLPPLQLYINAYMWQSKFHLSSRQFKYGLFSYRNESLRACFCHPKNDWNSPAPENVIAVGCCESS